ncbi:MAG: carbohydrate kinase [Granulosicoccus sp.]|nr:carbohydrate kinase [Granulosicoccus sp.]
MGRDVIIGVDSGTSMVKAVAFDFAGNQLAIASTPNSYLQKADGTATQSMKQTWKDCVSTLCDLATRLPDLDQRTAAIAVTGQGDGTWLVGRNHEPVDDAWLWLDSRSAPTVQRMRQLDTDAFRFQATGTGLNSCQQGMQLVHMQMVLPEMLKKTETAMHCKDWLYLKLTGERVTDPSEACFTFGNFRTRHYDDSVISSLGLTDDRSLLPPIVDGVKQLHSLTRNAARETGLLAGTPVCLGYVDVVCTAMGSGIHCRTGDAGCSIVGSTGMHMVSVRDSEVRLNPDRTGYVMVLPVAGRVSQMQSNMSATLNIDWILSVAADLLNDLGTTASPSSLLAHIDRWASAGASGSLLYHPYISEAGERGPFVNNDARAGFIGLSSSHRFPDLVRAVMEGLGMAAADCYGAMGVVPREVRLSGGAAKSSVLRSILSAAVGIPVRYSSRSEAGAAGAAMMAAVSLGVHENMDACVDAWVSPLLSELEQPDEKLHGIYRSIFPVYVDARKALVPIWKSINSLQEIGK